MSFAPKLKTALETHTLRDLIQNKNPTVFAHFSDTIDSVLTSLQKNDILSVPVFGQNREIAGLLSILDILTYISWGKYFTDGNVSDEEVTKFRHLSHTVSNILESKPKEKVWIYPIETKLIDLLSQNESVSHQAQRVIVTDTDEKGNLLPFVFSQTDIIRFLYTQKDNFQSLMAQTVDQLQLGTDKIASIPSDTRALDGFKKMSIENVTALAITDKENGKLIGNLSASDLRSLNSQKLPSILRYVGKFLVIQHKCVRKPITITGETTLSEIFDLFLNEKVHRVWKVDIDRKPIGMVSMSDIIQGIHRLGVGV